MNPKHSSEFSAMELNGELALMKDNYVYMNRRRKGMEASTITKAGGEMMRIHIIYFLSRMGRIEHPHFFRVHHLNQTGVYLRDVKRWLADLRGRDMPETFAWSYKRRYKSGYVWQDLLDDDLITPISDNEYVLKGSEIFVPTNVNPCDSSAAGVEQKASMLRNNNHVAAEHEVVEVEEKQQDQLPSPKEANRMINSLSKPSSENSQESPTFSSEISTLTDDSMKQEQDHLSKICKPHEEINVGKEENLSCSFYSNLLGNAKKKMSNYSIEKMGTPSSFLSSYSSESPFGQKSKNQARGTSKMLRNLITCRATDTNDVVLVALNKSSSKKPTNNLENNAEICKGDQILGESTRAFGTPWNQQQQQQRSTRKSFDGVKGSKKKMQQKQQSECGSSKVVNGAYKPVGAPTCSQCGKPFKPQKMHTHMKSCRGMKALAKSAAANSIEKTPPHISVTVNSSIKNQLVTVS